MPESETSEDWRDSTGDESMARAWLRNERLWSASRAAGRGVPEGYDLDLDARVLELVQEGDDPERGWHLVLTLLRLAEDEADFTRVAIGPLETFLRGYGDAFYDRIDERVQSDEAFRRAVWMTMAGWPGPHSRPAE